MTKPKPKTEIKRHRQPRAPGGRPNRVRVQLTDEQFTALQQVSQERQVGIPQILIEAHFQPKSTDPRTLMREVAGVRRIIDAEYLLLMKLTQQQAVDARVWQQIADEIDSRKEQLAARYGTCP